MSYRVLDLVDDFDKPTAGEVCPYFLVDVQAVFVGIPPVSLLMQRELQRWQGCRLLLLRGETMLPDLVLLALFDQMQLKGRV